MPPIACPGAASCPRCRLCTPQSRVPSPRCCRTAGPDALAAVRALLPVDHQLAVLVLRCRVYRALRHHSALLTCVAAVLVVVRHALADDAEVVQPRLHAVVRAAADADLELVRQLHAVPAEVELVVDAVGKGLRIRQAVHAHAPLQGTMGRTTLPVPPVTSPQASTAATSGSTFS